MAIKFSSADVIRQLADNAEQHPNAPLFQMLIPPLVTHLIGLTRDQAVDLFVYIWNSIEPSFQDLKKRIQEMQQSTEPVTTQMAADAGDIIIIEHIQKKGLPS